MRTLQCPGSPVGLPAPQHRRRPGGAATSAAPASQLRLTTGEKRLSLEVQDVAIEYGPKPRTAEPRAEAERTTEDPDTEDIPF